MRNPVRRTNEKGRSEKRGKTLKLLVDCISIYRSLTDPKALSGRTGGKDDTAARHVLFYELAAHKGPTVLPMASLPGQKTTTNRLFNMRAIMVTRYDQVLQESEK